MAAKALKGFNSFVRPFRNVPALEILQVPRGESIGKSALAYRRYLSSHIPLSQQPKVKSIAVAAKTYNNKADKSLYTAARKLTNSSSLSSTDDDLQLGPSSGLYYFDTHRLVSTLQSHGFSLEQSEAVTNALNQVVNTGTTALSKYMVKKNELAQLEIRMNATIEALRKDMVILEKSEFLMLKQENENLKAEVSNLSRLLKDELLKLKSSLTLDLSLEKGRTKEESSIHEQKVKDTNNRIDTEIARVRMEMEAQKLDLIKYLVGSFISVVTVLIGWWRFVKS